MPRLASPKLRALAQGEGIGESAEPQVERCELCGGQIPEQHRHLLDLDTRELLCACSPCSLLFDRPAAANGRYRRVPDRRLRMEGFELPDLVWEELRIPVEMAFFFRSSREGRTMAFYPSPMGPTESALGLEAWEEIERANPVLATLEDDVEALLVNRARGARGYWLVPIEDCYALVGLIRTHWRGFSGGKEVWEEIERFFAGLDERSKIEASPAGAEAGAQAGNPTRRGGQGVLPGAEQAAGNDGRR